MITRIEALSLTTSKLLLKCNGIVLRPATGFFYRKDGELYLVSNWHVFSGRNTVDSQPKHSKCYTPDAISFSFCTEDENGPLWENCSFQVEQVDGTADWWQHPSLGQKVDVAVTKVPLAIVSKQKYSAETENSPIKLAAGQDAFILGYPEGIRKQGNIPVWKRGSIASEPNLHTEDGKIILIDSATREGMSGSPVFVVDRTSYIKTVEGISERATAAKLIGVYSGRYGAGELETVQLGLCWKTELIDEIIAGKAPGTNKFN
jgi:hypothetical protein